MSTAVAAYAVREAREECGLESKKHRGNGEEVGLVKCGLPVGEPVLRGER